VLLERRVQRRIQVFGKQAEDRVDASVAVKVTFAGSLLGGLARFTKLLLGGLVVLALMGFFGVLAALRYHLSESERNFLEFTMRLGIFERVAAGDSLQVCPRTVWTGTPSIFAQIRLHLTKNVFRGNTNLYTTVTKGNRVFCCIVQSRDD
jgi:hypothetical protein